MNFKKIKDSLDRQAYLSLLSDLKSEFASEYLISDGWATKGHPIVVGIPYKRKSDLQKQNNGKTFHQKENEALSDALDIVKGYLMKHEWNPMKVDSVGFIYLEEFTKGVTDSEKPVIRVTVWKLPSYEQETWKEFDNWEDAEAYANKWGHKDGLNGQGYDPEMNWNDAAAKLKNKVKDDEGGHWEEFVDEDTGELVKRWFPDESDEEYWDNVGKNFDESSWTEEDEKRFRYRRSLYDLESAIEDKIAWTKQDLQSAQEYASQLQTDQEEELGPLYAEGNEAEAEERAQYYGQEMNDNQEEIETLEEDLEGLQDDLALVRMELDDPSSVDADQLMDLLTTYEVV